MPRRRRLPAAHITPTMIGTDISELSTAAHTSAFIGSTPHRLIPMPQTMAAARMP